MTENFAPYKNVIAENINGILKDELMLGQYAVSLILMDKIIEQSITRNNKHRPHCICDLLTPDQMHRQREIKKPAYKKKNSSRIFLTAKN